MKNATNTKPTMQDFIDALKEAADICFDLYADQQCLPDSDNEAIIAMERHIHKNIFEAREKLYGAVQLCTTLAEIQKNHC